MAESEVKKLESNQQQPAPGTGDEIEQLKSRVEKLCTAIDNEADGNLPGRDDLDEIRKVLEKIKGKITPTTATTTTTTGGDGDGDAELLPLSKLEELSNLVPTIERALQQRKHPRPKQDEDHRPAAETKAKLVSASGCTPFISKARASQRQSDQRRQEEEEEEEEVSLKLLLRLTENVLEPEQYYEWTTSYVDETRIYGWTKEADEVAAALVAPDAGDGSMFRAVGIAGVHGSGKTALAQKVFVHDLAKDKFALRLWVCVGPPDSEDRFCLLYRMLDNLGLDTYRVEDIVDESNAVKPHRDAALERIRNDKAKVDDIKNKAGDLIRKDPEKVAAIRKKAEEMAAKKRKAEEETGKKQPGSDDDVKTKEEGAVTANKDEQPPQEQEDIIFNHLLREEADESPEVQKSKIGVLLFILHMTLSKTSYMIVFDDIRAYDGDHGWYSNLSLPPPPPEREWGDRLGYGLPKGNQHRGAVLLTCRNEDHARSMVRAAGRVVRPPKLEPDGAWKLFRREYYRAKGQADEFKVDDEDGDDAFLKELKLMKEQIVGKCLGLPVAIAEAAKGFAALQPLPPDDAIKDDDHPTNNNNNNKPGAADQAATAGSNKDATQPAAEEGEPN